MVALLNEDGDPVKYEISKPINAYDRTSRGCEAYTALADELIRKNEK